IDRTFRACTVVGAGRLAVITPKQVVSYSWPEFHRDRALVFNGEIRNAARSVELVRPCESLRGAGVQTGRTTAATVKQRRGRGGKRERQQDFSQHKVTPGPRGNR